MRPSVERRPIARLRRGAFAAIPGFAIAILLQAGTARAELLREREPNDAPAAAQPLIAPLTIGGRVDPAGDVDVYSFRGEAGQAVTIDILARGFRAASGPGSALSALLQLWSDGGVLIAQDQSLGDFDDPTISAVLPGPGRYLISVRDLDPANGGPASRYLLSLEIDPNNVPSQATPVLPPTMTSLDGLIDPAGDQDCYRFAAAAGQVLTADIDAAVFNPDSPVETVLTVYDPAGRILIQDAWSLQDPTDPFVQLPLAAPGNYVVCVREVRGFVGTTNTFYQLILDLGPAAGNDLFATASPVLLPRAVSGTIGPSGDRDLYRFDLAGPATLGADLDAAQDLLSLLSATIGVQDGTGLLASNASPPDPALTVALGAGTFAASVAGSCSVSGCLDADRYYSLALDPDLDGDGIRLPADNCPLAANPQQEDLDRDGVGDACDACVDFFNPDTNDGRRPPAEAAPAGLGFVAGSSEALAWPAQPDSLGYNLYRGRLSPGATFAFAPVCLFDNLTDTQAADPDRPAPGELFYYELDAENECAEGPFGANSQGTPRAIEAAARCPARF